MQLKATLCFRHKIRSLQTGHLWIRMSARQYICLDRWIDGRLTDFGTEYTIFFLRKSGYNKAYKKYRSYLSNRLSFVFWVKMGNKH